MQIPIDSGDSRTSPIHEENDEMEQDQGATGSQQVRLRAAALGS